MSSILWAIIIDFMGYIMTALYPRENIKSVKAIYIFTRSYTKIKYPHKMAFYSPRAYKMQMRSSSLQEQATLCT